MDLGLTGKRALVLGSSKGLGHGIAEQLAAEGAHVTLVGRNEERLRQAAHALHEGLTSPAALTTRLANYLGAPTASASGLRLRREVRRRRRLLFLSPNGVGMGHLTRQLAIELTDRKVRVNAVGPGITGAVFPSLA